MNILVFNCGSSSVKYKLYDMATSSELAGGMVERIGEESSSLVHMYPSGEKRRDIDAPDHHKAIEAIAEVLTDTDEGALSDRSDLKGIGHRVVHGGEEYSDSVIVDDDVERDVERLSELAPLHNPPALQGIKACKQAFPGLRQVAVFDTAFHHSMPDHAYRYGLPGELYRKYRIRRYGFHGTSHRYVSRKAAEELGTDPEKFKAITVHLGNGCSVSAVNGTRSIDTSMGFTPLEGLIMGTRSGDLDPAVITFIMQKEGLTPVEVEEVLNKESGLLGISGISQDMRDILEAMDGGDENALLAFRMFIYRIKKYIGAYAAALGEVEAVVFTGGIGENVPHIRVSIEKDLEALFKRSPAYLTISTNEELLIASDTQMLLEQGDK